MFKTNAVFTKNNTYVHVVHESENSRFQRYDNNMGLAHVYKYAILKNARAFLQGMHTCLLVALSMADLFRRVSVPFCCSLESGPV